MNAWRDLRYAARGLSRAPGFAALALLTLAFAIGANVAIFSVVDSLLLRPLPLPQGERVVTLLRHFPDSDSDAVSEPKYFYWREHGAAFTAVAAFESLGSGFNLAAEGKPERIVGAHVSASFFDVFGERPSLGRSFLAEEDRPGAAHAVVLSDALWRRRFGADPAILGRSLRLNGEPYVVVGVMPAELRFPARAELWTPFCLNPASREPEPYLEVVARLRAGTGVAAAQSVMDLVARRFASAFPDQVRTIEGIHVVPLQAYLYGDLRPALLVLLAAVGAVLLIACVNLAGLQLARAAARRREIALRTALGASRRRIVAQLLAESLLLGSSGGLAGLLLGSWCLRPLLAASPLDPSRQAQIGMDGRVLLFALGVSVLSALLFGLAPALHSVRGDIQAALRGGGALPARASGNGWRGGRAGSGGPGGRAGRAGRGGRFAHGGPGGGWTRRLLVAAEVALALILAANAMLLARSFVHLLRTGPGFAPDQVLTGKLSLPEGRYGSGAAIERFADQLLARVGSLPGVREAAIASTLPLEDGPPVSFIFPGRYQGGTSGEGVGVARYRAVTRDFFRTLRIGGVRGRTFDAADRRGGPLVAVVNEAAVRRYWRGEDPLGARIVIGPPSTRELGDPGPRTIVGIVRDVHEMGLDKEPPPIVYVPLGQMPDPMARMFIRLLPLSIAVRSAGALPELPARLEQQVAKVDPEQPLTEISAMDEIVSRSLGRRRFTAMLLGMMSLLALALAALGIYGVISYLVAQRTREIGIRMALGASPSSILRLVVRQGMSAVLLGIAAGLAGALALTRLLGSLIYGVGAHDPLSFVLTPALLALIAVLACAVPAHRASNVDPLVALRSD
jgi:putative ABC transport system permease protein